MGAVVAGDHDIEKFDHDLGVDVGQVIEGETAVFERDDKRFAHGAEIVHVAVDERPPHARVHARHPARQPFIADDLAIGGTEPVEDERLGPLLQTRIPLRRIGRRHGFYPRAVAARREPDAFAQPNPVSP